MTQQLIQDGQRLLARIHHMMHGDVAERLEKRRRECANYWVRQEADRKHREFLEANLYPEI